MKRMILFLASVMMLISVNVAAKEINIVPKPLKMEITEGGTFNLTAKTPIILPKNNTKLLKTAQIYADAADKILGAKMSVKYARHSDNAVNLDINNALTQEEYTIGVTPSRVLIAGGSAKAVMYGLQTLTQIAVSSGINNGIAQIPTLKIEDKPFFEYRGSMLDIVRYHYSVDDVKSFIDILALHKMNKFHFHLTDDQGWRIEIKKYPELTRKGSIRKETPLGHYTDKKWDTQPYGGFYTQEQIRDIVSYATDRHIDVIPEIELPGHATAALASYQWLGCLQSGYEVSCSWGVHKDLFCAGRESTFELLEGVLAEVLELFPSKYIHIGGDECPKDRWKECPECQKRIKDNNLKDETELQSYFVHRMEKWLNEQGRSIIGWDEIMDGGLSKSATVMSWRGATGGIKAAQMGNKVIMAPNIYCYLDYYQASPDTEPLSINKNRIVTVEKTYSFDPYDKLDESQRQYIWGVQGNLWTEYIKNFVHVEYMVLPRLAALSEVGWSYPRKDYDDFVRRMQTFRKMYDAYGYNYAKHIFTQE